MSKTDFDCEVSIRCVSCGTVHRIEVYEKDFDLFVSENRPHIQDIFPYLKPAERELLLSRVCEKCWNKMFGGEDDE